jgi:hypothetical protein
MEDIENNMVDLDMVVLGLNNFWLFGNLMDNIFFVFDERL